MKESIKRLLNNRLGKFLNYYSKVLKLALKKWWKFARYNLILSGVITLIITVLQQFDWKKEVWENLINLLSWKTAFSVIVVYVSFLIITWLINVIRAPFLLDEEKDAIIINSTVQDSKLENPQKREHKIQQLREFIKEKRELDSWGGIKMTLENMGRIGVRNSYPSRVEKFLEDYFDESYVKRFQDKGTSALEDFLKELLR